MAGYIKNVDFPKLKEKTLRLSLDEGIKCTDVLNRGGFSRCENLSYKHYPIISPSDLRVSSYSQFKYYNLTSPSTVFAGDGGSSMFSFDDYILLIRWGMCGENIRNGYQYVREGKLVTRDYKKGYHYVICDCLKPINNTLFLNGSAVIFDEYEESIYNSDYEMFADPTIYVETDINPQDMNEPDETVVYYFNGNFYYYDQQWISMKLNRTYLYNKKLYYFDSYLECWLPKKSYSDLKRDAKVFSEWSTENSSLMFGKYKKYIVIMPDAVAIELDESGYPKADSYYDGEWLGTSVLRGDNSDTFGLKIHKLDAVIRDSNGNSVSFTYPQITALSPDATRLFLLGEGRIYATKPNTMNDFSYDSSDDFSKDNAWAVSVSNEGVSSSKLCAICNYMDEIIAFSPDAAYKIYGKTNPFRIGMLFNYGTFSQKSVCECEAKLYFVNQEGIFCYNGTSISCISKDINHGKIFNAVITSAEGILYIYLDCDLNKAIYTYDTENKCFLEIALPYDSYIEDDERQIKDIVDMISFKKNIYILTYASYDTRPGGTNTINFDTSKVQIYCITSGSAKHLEYKEKWFFETNPFNTYIPDMQRVTSLEMVVKGDGDNKLKVYLLSGDEEPNDTNLLFEQNCPKKLCVLRYALRKTEGLFHRLYVEGEGDVFIYSIDLKLISGGEKFESNR